MKLLKLITEGRVESEEAAKQAIEDATAKAAAEGYTIASAGYTYKSKKSKGEVIDEAYIVKIVEEHNTVWD